MRECVYLVSLVSLVPLVYLVSLVYLVYLVSLVYLVYWVCLFIRAIWMEKYFGKTELPFYRAIIFTSMFNIINFYMFDFSIYPTNDAIMKLPTHRAGLPGKEISFLLYPLTPPARRGLRGTCQPPNRILHKPRRSSGNDVRGW